MSGSDLLLISIFLPLLATLLIPMFGKWQNIREAVTLTAAVLLLLTVVSIFAKFTTGETVATSSFEVLPGLPLAFEVEPLGMMFALVASVLWIVNSLYSIGYMRSHDEPRQTPFYMCFAVALSSTMGIAFASNLFTLFLFYEILTLSTYPLVSHKADEKAINGGRIYLIMLLGTSMLLLLPAIIITAVVAGTLDFASGGILTGKVDDTVLALLLALYAFGIGKAAVMPVHFWLPAAMVAPTPVSALLHAVAVVKAGVFTVIKIVVYVFGIENLTKTGASDWLVFVAAFSLITASIVALTRDNLKARLAYSTVSQLAYVVLGAALASSAAIVGSGMQIVMHAAGKITLFFCAGAIMVATHKTEISDMVGIGRRMPITMGAFLIGSLSIIGLPPLGGVWSKWWLGVGAIDAGHEWVVAVLMISSLLSAAYLLPIVAWGFLMAPPDTKPGARVEITEAPLACVVSICITAGLCIMLFFGANWVESKLATLDFGIQSGTTALIEGDRHGR